MANNEPIIRALPTAGKFCELVDIVITPERADDEAKAFVDIILTIANPEDDKSMHLANTAARHAFSMTSAFEAAFREFAGYPDRPGYVADRYLITAKNADMRED